MPPWGNCLTSPLVVTPLTVSVCDMIISQSYDRFSATVHRTSVVFDSWLTAYSGAAARHCWPGATKGALLKVFRSQWLQASSRACTANDRQSHTPRYEFCNFDNMQQWCNVNVGPIDQKFPTTVLFCSIVFAFYIFCPSTLVSPPVDSIWRRRMCSNKCIFERKVLFSADCGADQQNVCRVTEAKQNCSRLFASVREYVFYVVFRFQKTWLVTFFWNDL